AKTNGVKNKAPGVPADGEPHRFAFSYDPAGTGTVTFKLDDREPITLALPDDFKKFGATFDRFGLMPEGKAGGPMTFYLTELTTDGQKQDFSHDPNWVGVGNHATFNEPEISGVQNFGFSADANVAGGKEKGELGGIFWRRPMVSSYADAIGPLSMDD